MLPSLRTSAPEFRTKSYKSSPDRNSGASSVFRPRSSTDQDFGSRRLSKSQEVRHRAQEDVFDDEVSNRMFCNTKSPSKLPAMVENKASGGSRRGGDRSLTLSPAVPRSPGVKPSNGGAVSPLRMNKLDHPTVRDTLVCWCCSSV